MFGGISSGQTLEEVKGNGDLSSRHKLPDNINYLIIVIAIVIEIVIAIAIVIEIG